MIKIAIIIFVFSSLCYAGMETPPPDDDIFQLNWKQNAQQYMNNPTIPSTTTNPDGNRLGKLNQVILYTTASGIYLMICASPPTVWKGIRIDKIE